MEADASIPRTPSCGGYDAYADYSSTRREERGLWDYHARLDRDTYGVVLTASLCRARLSRTSTAAGADAWGCAACAVDQRLSLWRRVA
jgi:hypothetical protein